MHKISDYQLAIIKESAQDNLKILKQLQSHDPSVYRMHIEIRDTELVLEIVEEIRKGN
ncbi:hypothetical protein UFOVP1323_59 [uncultured Caudovirales phage]|uniref:Uncharacterized protein n=1 Tax=uncultured Caudovirales phage TaxID=2100421 RepID=A0A6J5RUL5_9CAUD|nr:hypothetical protein UFOVP1323_59 [uncultured Caudovirales phage]